ncbi:MAG: T9SS type A sorting domain-containing protein [Bacteroidales bacterium]|jgi:hypothetical protein|nr:T9SS type A sorting domain-containing protein [Bacteroidales bacterium]
MKKLILSISCVLIATIAFATNQPTTMAEAKAQYKKEREAIREAFMPNFKPEKHEKLDREARFQRDLQKKMENSKALNEARKNQRTNPQTERKIENSLTKLIRDFSPNVSWKNPKAEGLKTFHKLDSVTLFNDDPNDMITYDQVAYYSYTVIDDYYYPHKLTVVGRGIVEGELLAEVIFEWHTEGALKGYLKSHSDFGINSWGWPQGEKFVYSYDAQNRVDTVWGLDYDGEAHLEGMPGVWLYDQMDVYVAYDANDNPIEVHIYVYGDGAWHLAAEQSRTVDHLGRTLTYESWGWDFAEVSPGNWDYVWKGIDKTQYEYFQNYMILTFWQIESYDLATETWIPDEQMINTFEMHNTRPEVTYTEHNYWNKITGDWSGNICSWGICFYNYKHYYTYDNAANNYKPLSARGESFVDGAWIDDMTTTIVWTPNPSTGVSWRMESTQSVIFHNFNPGVWEVFEIATIDYSSAFADFLIGERWTLREIINPGGFYGEKFINTFTANGTLITNEFYESWDGGIVWDPVVKIVRELDAVELPAKSWHYMPEIDWDTWMPTGNWDLYGSFTYEHASNGARTKTMGWCGEIGTTPLNGWEYDADWTIPIDELIIWKDYYFYTTGAGDFHFTHKVNTYIHYLGNSDCWYAPYTTWATATQTYFWSEVEALGTSIQDVIVDDMNTTVRVYPNPVKDVLHIQTEQTIQSIFVFDMNGKMVVNLRGNQQTIDLQSLQTGNYVVRIHTDKVVVPVKIVKQ